MSDSLRSLRGNERMSDSLKKVYLKKSKILFLVCFIYYLKKNLSLISSFLVSNVSDSLISLKSNEWCERIAQVAHQIWATMSNLLRSLREYERSWVNRQVANQKWANEWITHFFEGIAHSLFFGQKTSDSLGNQMSEFPALQNALCQVVHYKELKIRDVCSS